MLVQERASSYRVHAMRSYAPSASSFEALPFALKLNSAEPATDRPTQQESLASAEATRAQLSKIISSSIFSGLTKTKQFLVYIVEETLAGNSSLLKQYNIATKAFGRDSSFDPDLDPVVRLEAGRLRKALDSYYLHEGASDRIRIAIPKGGYIPFFNGGRANSCGCSSGASDTDAGSATLVGGGTRRAPIHLDMPLRGCSVLLDGEPMVLSGVVIPDDQRI